ncbi:MAG: 3-dehydroquinate synthase [Alphaproteobacteria bacterium]
MTEPDTNEGKSPPRRTNVAVELDDRAYDILIGRDLLDSAGLEIAKRFPGARACIITDSTVEHLYAKPLVESLEAAAVHSATVVVPAGEESKNFERLALVVDGILGAHMERGDVVVALGGGVVGDLGGFAAAIARRGMRVVQIPTTLLAQVDSSVGGKTGINTARGKNLVGVFHQPQLVIADSSVLDTLPPRVFNAGYAELAKIGLIGDADFFGWLENNWRAIVAGWPERDHAIATACRAKAEVVAADEREQGSRALLNLGHTFGHALETATGYTDRLLHGEAVSIGMVLAHEFSAELDLCGPDVSARVAGHLADIGLPTQISDIPGEPLQREALISNIGQDKKVERGKLTFILSRGIGEAFIARDIPAKTVSAFLDRKLAT